MKFKIIFEDEQILVVDKPTGLVVNRSQTTHEETLQDQLASYFHLKPGDMGIGDRAGIVHRLDRETSGILVVAKTQRAFDALQAQFKERSIKKEYIALVHGRVKSQAGSIAGDIGRIGKFGKFGIIKLDHLRGVQRDGLVHLGGVYSGDKKRHVRSAATEYEVIKKYKFNDQKFANILQNNQFSKSRINYLKNHTREYSLLKVFPLSGRTHQVRVHLKSIGNPVVSDLIYSPKKLLKFDFLWCPRLFLHAAKIEFIMPGNKKSLPAGRQVVFESPLPYDLIKAQAYLDRLPDG